MWFSARNDKGYRRQAGYDYYSGDYDYYDDTAVQPTSFETKMSKFVRYLAKGKL